MEDLEQGSQRKLQLRERLKKNARALGGYALGYAGVGIATIGLAGSAPIAGPAIGAGLLHTSRKVMRPLYEHEATNSQEVAAEQSQQESKLRRFGRGLIFSAGMAVNFVGAVFLGNAIFGGHGLNAGERVASGLFGVAALLPGDSMVRASYDQKLYEQVDLQNQQQLPSPAEQS